MKIKAIIGLFLLLAAGFINGQVPDSLKFASLKPDEFQLAYVRESGPILVDVREFFEYKKSRIKNAVNLPASGNLQIAADSINKDVPLFLYCTSGFRSKRVAKFFCANGFTKVYSLDGGIKAWREEGKTVDKKRIRRHDKREKVVIR